MNGALAAGAQLLADNQLVGSSQELARLVERYAGNPLALKIVVQTIAERFGAQGTVVFGSITDLLDEQVARLSTLEQTVLYWLAIVREPMTLEELRAVPVARLSPVQVLEAVDGLRRHSLVERGQRPGSFTLQSVVLEYVTAQLVAQASDEIQHFFPVLSPDLDPVQDEINDLFREVCVERFVGQEQANIQWANYGFSQQLRIDGRHDLPSLHRTLENRLHQGKAPAPVGLACRGYLWVTCCRDKQLRDSGTQRRLKKHPQLL